jgi:hypothetical protein
MSSSTCRYLTYARWPSRTRTVARRCLAWTFIMNEGVIVADGPTGKILADAKLMRASRLELPYGFNPLSV